MRTIEDLCEINIAWNLLKEIENLQHSLLQRYHEEFLKMEKKEELFRSFEDNLPF